MLLRGTTIFILFYFASSVALASDIACELTVKGKTEKSSDISAIALKVQGFLCRAKKEAGDMIRLRITSQSTDEKVDEVGYMNVTENLYVMQSGINELEYATCVCQLKN